MSSELSMRGLADWRNLKNKYSGSVFILASGPSANNFPLNKYSNYPIIAVNGSVTKLLEANIKPLFYIGTDLGAISHLGELVIDGVNSSHFSAFSQSIFDTILLANKDLLDKQKLEEVYLLEKSNRLDRQNKISDRWFALKNLMDKDLTYEFSFFSQRKNRIGFSHNLEKGYYCARTIVYTAVQLAKFLGFSKVFIVGMDLSSETRFYEADSNSYDTFSLLGNYDRFIAPSFEILSKHVLNKNFSVFNLSVDSRLPSSVLNKIDFTELDNYL